MKSGNHNDCHNCGQKPNADGSMPLHKCKYYDQEFHAMSDIVAMLTLFFASPGKESMGLVEGAYANYIELAKKLNKLDGYDEEANKKLGKEFLDAMLQELENIKQPQDPKDTDSIGGPNLN